MNKLSILRKIIRTLKELIRLYKILIAREKGDDFPGQANIISIIREIAKEYDVNPELAIRIAKCESNLIPKAVRINQNGTIDRGLYQWNDFYHPEITNECAFNIRCSTTAFCKAVKNGNINWWFASKQCWG